MIILDPQSPMSIHIHSEKEIANNMETLRHVGAMIGSRRIPNPRFGTPPIGKGLNCQKPRPRSQINSKGIIPPAAELSNDEGHFFFRVFYHVPLSTRAPPSVLVYYPRRPVVTSQVRYDWTLLAPMSITL